VPLSASFTLVPNAFQAGGSVASWQYAQLTTLPWQSGASGKLSQRIAGAVGFASAVLAAIKHAKPTPNARRGCVIKDPPKREDVR
jgi:hypothetical protein